VAEHEQPVVLADPRRLQALRRALEERAVLTYCTDGATFHYQRPLSAGLPVGSYVTLEIPGGATYLGQVITQQVVLGEGPLIRIELDMDLTDEAGASKVSQLTTPLRLRLLEGTGTVLGRLSSPSSRRPWTPPTRWCRCRASSAPSATTTGPTWCGLSTTPTTSQAPARRSWTISTSS